MVLEFFQSGFWEELWQREPSWKLPLGRWCPWPNSPFLSPVHLCSFHSLQRMQKITVRTISTQSRYNSIVIKVQNSSRKQENGLFANLHFCVFNFIVRGLKMTDLIYSLCNITAPTWISNDRWSKRFFVPFDHNCSSNVPTDNVPLWVLFSPFLSTHKARGTCPFRESSSPTTAQSTTAGWSRTA